MHSSQLINQSNILGLLLFTFAHIGEKHSTNSFLVSKTRCGAFSVSEAPAGCAKDTDFKSKPGQSQS